MRPALFLTLVLVTAGCALAGAKTPAPTAPPPRLLPLEEILPAPAPATSAASADALAARGAALRAGAQP